MGTLKVIVTSTRPARIGPKVAAWTVSRAEQMWATSDIDIVDLAAVDLPFLDEAEQPSTGTYRLGHTLRWKAIIDEAAAVLIVTPEYNSGYPATIKNALDTLFREWHDKPIGLLGYGWRGAATATAGLGLVLGHVKADQAGVVNLHFRQDLSVEGELTPRPEKLEELDALLSRLHTRQGRVGRA